MNTPSVTSPYACGNVRNRRDRPADPYASMMETTALLRSSAQWRRDRMKAADMITTDEAAELAGTSRVMINAWMKAGRCIGVSNLRRRFKLPRWQFEPTIWPLLQPLAKCLGSSDGWQLLAFLETPSITLDRRTPRAALEQGVPGERILSLAMAEAH